MTQPIHHEDPGTVTCSRRLEWDAMHRVPGHAGPCRAYHGHRYAATLTCEGAVTPSGMIIDFGEIKRVVGAWIDDHWDHTAILWENDDDPAVQAITESNRTFARPVYFMRRPPTAEEIAKELAEVATELLSDFLIAVVEVTVAETPNCSATWRRRPDMSR